MDLQQILGTLSVAGAVLLAAYFGYRYRTVQRDLDRVRAAANAWKALAVYASRRLKEARNDQTLSPDDVVAKLNDLFSGRENSGSDGGASNGTSGTSGT